MQIRKYANFVGLLDGALRGVRTAGRTLSSPLLLQSKYVSCQEKNLFFKFISLVKIHLIRKLLFSIIIHKCWSILYFFIFKIHYSFKTWNSRLGDFTTSLIKFERIIIFNIEKTLLLKKMLIFLKKIKIWPQIFQNAIPTCRTLECADVPRMVARSRSPTCGVRYAYFSFIDFLLLFLSGIYFEYMREWTWLIEFF